MGGYVHYRGYNRIKEVHRGLREAKGESDRGAERLSVVGGVR